MTTIDSPAAFAPHPKKTCENPACTRDLCSLRNLAYPPLRPFIDTLIMSGRTNARLILKTAMRQYALVGERNK